MKQLQLAAARHIATAALMCLVITSMMVSCSNDDVVDGDWDPMKWEVPANVTKVGDNYQVAAAGDSVVFACTNYAGFWFNRAEYTLGDSLHTAYGWQYSNDEHHKWLELDEKTQTATPVNEDSISWKAKDKGNLLIAVFKPNDTGMEKTLTLYIESGDAFGLISFVQPPLQAAGK